MALDPHINPVTKVWDDNYYASHGSGSSSSSGGGGVDSILNTAIDSLSGLFPKQVKPYDQVNPFSFDEALATQASTAEYAPYYQQMLSDYNTGVTNTLKRSQQDLSTTLSQLQKGKDYYTGTQGRLHDSTLLNTNNSYANNGLFFSGARERTIGNINTQYGADMGNYENQYGYNVNQANQAAQRTGQDVNLAQSQYTRDTGQSQKSAIAQGVLQRKTEAQNQYEIGRQNYYSAAQYGA